MRETFKKIIVQILKLECQLVLWKYKPKIVAITGSVGKTSTKDAVYAVLAKVAYVRKSEKSYNSQIGLPLTILGIQNGWNNPYIWFKNILVGFWLFLWPHKYPKWLVLEVGVGKPGDMKETASWLRTDAVIITAIGDTPVHIEFFESRKHLIEEKSGLIQTLKKDGILVLNADDEAVIGMKTKTKCALVTYGFGGEPTLKATSENVLYENNVPVGVAYKVDVGGNSLPVLIEGVFGTNHVYATLASLALSVGLKLNILDAINSVKKYDVPPGRMRLLRGLNDTLIIDDTYNSSPYACESALKTLGEIKCTGKKIAVLGDMLELGKHTEEAHKNIGRVAEGNCDILVVVGPRAKSIKEGALSMTMKQDTIHEFLNSREAGDFLKSFIQKGDVVLIKGSQGMRMERTVEAVLLDIENKESLLVRQDKEWLDKK